MIKIPRRQRRQFVWIKPDFNTKWTITIEGIDVSRSIIKAAFSLGLITEELGCKIDLENSGGGFTNKFIIGSEIIFKMDFSGGSTVQFKGKVERIDTKIVNGFFRLAIKGSHPIRELIDVLVTAEFTDAQLSDIRTTLIDDNLTGFTTNNIVTNTTTTDIKFVNKPLLDCLISLDVIGNEDTYIDVDKDFHTFKRGNNINDDEAVIQNQSLINLRGLGQDSADVKNKVTVYGEAGGITVISTSEDSGSQATFGTKEIAITDTSIGDETQAKDTSDAETLLLKQPSFLGSADCFLLPKLNPGDMIYVVSKTHAVHDRFRVVKFSYFVPTETCTVYFNKEKSIPKLFKDRIRKDLAQEVIVNPNKMTQSFNFGTDTGFNENKIDFSASNEVKVVGENLQMDGSVESANMISITKATPIDVNSVEIRVIGESLGATRYYINAEGLNNWQQITLNTDTVVNDIGKKLRLRIEIADTTTRISSAAILYK